MENVVEISIIPEPGLIRKSGVYVDGKLVRYVSHSVISVKICMSVPKDSHFFENLKAHEYQGAYQVAIKALSRQMLHSNQLAQKLKKHFVEEDLIQGVIDSCRQKGYLCDEEVISSLAKKWEHQGKSRLETRDCCRRLGLPASNTLVDEEKALAHVITKKYPQLLSQDLGYLDRCKIMRSLTRRGFSYDLVCKVLREKS